jgi:hypothetical protein
MTIQNPVGGSPEDPYEKYKKYDIGNEEKRGKKFGEEPPKKKLPKGSFFLILLYKILDFLLHLGKSKSKISGDLSDLKDAFEAMRVEDKSQDIAFLNKLSEIWRHALEHSMSVKSDGFRVFVKKIQNYPEGADHTFGYYLTEYTSEEWLPFPYMELIQNLHEEYQRNAEGSALNLWIQELERINSSE